MYVQRGERWCGVKIHISPVLLTVIIVCCVLYSCAERLPDQDAPERTVAQVDASGQKIIQAYQNPALAEYGVLDVTLSPYHADPTGERDATAAIQQAIKDARDVRAVTYLPAGRYRITETLTGIQGTVEWNFWPYEGYADPWVGYASFEYPCMLMGPPEGGRAVLVLDDNARGFDNPEQLKPVVHFWSRMEWGSGIDKTKPQPSINFNQKIVDIDFELGDGNPGAVAINHQGAEGSVIEDVHIEAAGAFAGIQNAPGSGGAIHGVSVNGGRFGIYIRNQESFRASQPAPVVSAVRLLGQSEQAILYDGRGPLTVVGAVIEGAGIRSDCPVNTNFYGALNIIDASIQMRRDSPAIESNHSVVLYNVYIHNAAMAVKIQDEWTLAGNPGGWIHVEEAAAAAVTKAPPLAGGQPRRDDLWLDGKKQTAPVVETRPVAPEDVEALIGRHDWPRPFPSRLSAGAVNVKEIPWRAVGDGVADDAEALQRAIDTHEIVFLPRGRYAVSRPLQLHAHTQLIGLGNVQTVITAHDSTEAFNDPDHPQPLIETVDDPQARTILAFMKLEVPVRNPCVYALRWRAGRHSIVRNVYPIREHRHPHGAAMGHPMVRIEGSGGGRWYTNVLLHWWDQGPDYRHLLIDGTREPLAFYMLEPQHARSETMVELRDAQNVDIFSVKAEGDYGILSMRDSRNIRLFGYGGNGMPKAGWSIITVQNCRDFLLANINPQFKSLGHWGALGISHNPAGWNVLTETAVNGDAIQVRGTEQFALYKRGNPRRTTKYTIE